MMRPLKIPTSIEEFDMSTYRVALVPALMFVLTAGSLAAQSPADPPFRLYGYLSQGIGATDDLPVAGLPTTGTTDYRTMALQARYRVDDRSNVVAQISHRRIGDSPLAPLEPALELDWAFYRRAIGPVQLSVGRIPIPRGFYNEVRDVGTILPFFRAPVSIYPDCTEAVDGVSATTRTQVGDWTLEANVFAGGMEWKGVVSDEQQLYPFASRAERNVGSQLWLSTPIEGVRVGASVSNFEDETAESGRNTSWVASAEIDRDRWMVRSEVASLTAASMDILSGYAHARFKVTPRLHVMGQYEQTDIGMTDPVELEWTEMRDAALGVAFVLLIRFVFKFEGYQVEGFGFDMPMNRVGPEGTSRYGILSMSVSF
jgi:hypothetical protein